MCTLSACQPNHTPHAPNTPKYTQIQDAAQQLGTMRRTANKTLGALEAAAAALSSVANATGHEGGETSDGEQHHALWDIQVGGVVFGWGRVGRSGRASTSVVAAAQHFMPTPYSLKTNRPHP